MEGRAGRRPEIEPAVIVKEFLEYVLRQLVEHPDDLLVHALDREDGEILFRIELRESDIGRVIGKSGSTIRSIRTLLEVAAAKQDRRVSLEVIREADGDSAPAATD